MLILVLLPNLIGCSSSVNSNELGEIQKKDTFEKCPVFKNSRCAMDYHSETNFVVTASSDGMVEVWSLDKSQPSIFFKHADGTPTAVFSHDGTKVATGSYDGIVRIWDVSSQQLISEFKGHDNIVFKLRFSPDDKKLASVSSDNTARLWDIKSGTGNVIAEHDGDVWGIAFSPDGEVLLTGGEDGVINVWHVESRALVKSLPNQGGAVLALSFSNDGKRFASGGDGQQVQLWETTSWSLIKTLDDDAYSIYDIKFSPNGKLLVAGGRDRGGIGEFLQYHFQYQFSKKSPTVRIWNIDNQTVKRRLRDHADDVKNITFSADGTKLLTSSVDGTVIEYKINLQRN